MVLFLFRKSIWNKALLTKWIWSFSFEKKLYGEKCPLLNLAPLSIYNWESFLGYSPKVHGSLSFSIEISFRKALWSSKPLHVIVCFCEDNWVGDDPLGVCYLELYVVSLKKKSTVVDCWDNVNQIWNLGLGRGICDCDLIGLVSLEREMEQVKSNGTSCLL